MQTPERYMYRLIYILKKKTKKKKDTKKKKKKKKKKQSTHLLQQAHSKLIPFSPQPNHTHNIYSLDYLCKPFARGLIYIGGLNLFVRILFFK